MSKKTEKKTTEKQEKETSMRFERDWIGSSYKRGIAKQIEKRAKSMTVVMTAEQLERHNQKMAPKRARREKHRHMKKFGQSIAQANA